jgi:hypothetical protein
MDPTEDLDATQEFTPVWETTPPYRPLLPDGTPEEAGPLEAAAPVVLRPDLLP